MTHNLTGFAVRAGKIFAYFNDDIFNEFPVATMLDIDGDETEEVDLCETFVVQGPDQQWYTVNFDDYSPTDKKLS